LKVPLLVGVPLIVIVFEANAAVTPDGNPVGEPIPVAPVVLWVIGVREVLMHKVGVEDGPEAVLLGVTVMVPVAFTVPQPPVRGIL
jgi:hypothetical protein